MSYLTAFKLEADVEGIEEIIKDLHSVYEITEMALDSDGDFENKVYWYTHEEDMAEFSKRYPEILFTLYGEGEDNTDIWREYFKNGKYHTIFAKISFDDFDESMLS